MCPALDLHTSGANWSPGITGYSTTTSVQSQLTQRGTRQLRPLPTSGLAKLVTAFRHRNIRIHVIYTYLLQEAWVRRIQRLRSTLFYPSEAPARVWLFGIRTHRVANCCSVNGGSQKAVAYCVARSFEIFWIFSDWSRKKSPGQNVRKTCRVR